MRSRKQIEDEYVLGTMPDNIELLLDIRDILMDARGKIKC